VGMGKVPPGKGWAVAIGIPVRNGTGSGPEPPSVSEPHANITESPGPCGEAEPEVMYFLPGIASGCLPHSTVLPVNGAFRHRSGAVV